MIKITLEPHEIALATTVGVHRRLTRTASGYGDRYGMDPSEGFDNDIEGARGEMALAKWLGIYWDGKAGVPTPGDVGRVDVRTTRYASGCLTIHPNDQDDREFVLATGSRGVYVLRGWVYAREAKRDELWGELQKNRPAWNLPQSLLHPIMEIHDRHAARGNVLRETSCAGRDPVCW